MYYYKDICSGEIVDVLVTNDRKEIENKIKNGNFMFSDFEVIYGEDITEQFFNLNNTHKTKKE